MVLLAVRNYHEALRRTTPAFGFIAHATCTALPMRATVALLESDFDLRSKEGGELFST